MLSDKFIALGEKYNTIREHVAAPYMRKSFFSFLCSAKSGNNGLRTGFLRTVD